jgi:hypothetical protein
LAVWEHIAARVELAGFRPNIERVRRPCHDASGKMRVLSMSNVVSSTSKIIADPKRLVDDMHAGLVIELPDVGYTIAPTSALMLSSIEDVDGEDPADMVSLRKDRTGVDNTIFVSTKGNARHAARIKIAVDPPDSLNAGGKTASMTVHDCKIIGEYMEPRVAEHAKRFIEANRDVLLSYWNFEVDTATLLERLRRP